MENADRVVVPSGSLPDVPSGVRLSPVERRNLALINDPALEGFVREGRHARERKDDGLACEGARGAHGVHANANESASMDAGADVAERTGGFSGGFRYEVNPDDTVRLLSYEGDAGESATRVMVPDQIEGRAVVALAEGLFRAHGELEHVDLPQGLRVIGAHVFDECVALRHVDLPASLEEIGNLAFAKSGLESIGIPASVSRIGEKAFFACKSLRSCTFAAEGSHASAIPHTSRASAASGAQITAEACAPVVPHTPTVSHMPRAAEAKGMLFIGDEAFAYSGLERIELPSTLDHLGFRAFDQTPAQRRVREGAVSVAEGSARYRIDAEGGLYCGNTLAELIGCCSTYAVQPGTQGVGPSAFCRNARIRRVILPEGLVEIGDDAFRGCRRLTQVALPDSLEVVGARAFLDTALGALRLGANLRQVGESALLVQGKSPLRSPRALMRVDIAAENPVFYRESGLLCQRGAGESGGDLCLLYVGPENVVRIPRAVNRIAACAFCGTSDVDELFVHAHLHSVCWEAFSTVRSIPLVHVEFPQVIDGYGSGDFPVPSLSARFRSVTNLLTTDAQGTVFNFPYYDSWVAHAAAIEEFAPAAVSRLMHPVGLSERARELYLGIFARKQDKACAFFAQRGNLEALDLLSSSGVLERQTVLSALDEATRCSQAQATACLLELMRRRGWHASVDLSL